MLAFQLIVALKRTHKPRSKLVAEHCHALEQLLLHFASGSCRIVTESDEFVYLLAKLSARIKLHNVPVSFTTAISLLEQPGASFFHQDISFRSLMWLHQYPACGYPCPSDTGRKQAFLKPLCSYFLLKRSLLICNHL